MRTFEELELREPQSLAPDSLVEIDRRIAQASIERTWRPNLIAILVNDKNEALFVLNGKAALDGCNWSLVGGGADMVAATKDAPARMETAIEALIREIEEEVGIPKHRLKITGLLHQGKAPFRKGQVGKDGYTEGKWYIYFRVEVIGDPILILESKLVHAEWSSDVYAKIMTMREKKRAQVIEAFRRAGIEIQC